MKRYVTAVITLGLTATLISCSSDDTSEPTGTSSDATTVETDDAAPDTTVGAAPNTTAGTDDTASSTPAEPATAYDRDAELQIVAVIPPRNPDPHQETVTWDHTFYSPVYERLIAVGTETDTFGLRPMLATE
ncbi:MAG: hypothetical protein AB7Q27_24165, partial [Acidimicrobiia bacterium]